MFRNCQVINSFGCSEVWWDLLSSPISNQIWMDNPACVQTTATVARHWNWYGPENKFWQDRWSQKWAEHPPRSIFILWYKKFALFKSSNKYYNEVCKVSRKRSRSWVFRKFQYKGIRSFAGENGITLLMQLNWKWKCYYGILKSLLYLIDCSYRTYVKCKIHFLEWIFRRRFRTEND